MTGFTETYWMATGFLVVAALSGLLIPVARAAIASSSAGDELAAEVAAA